MTWGEAVWLALGWVTGVLSLMQAEVWRARRRRTPEERHPMMYRIPTPAGADWDAAVERELVDAFTPTPRRDEVRAVMRDLATVPPDHCPQCARGPFRRVSQHQRMAHPGVTP